MVQVNFRETSQQSKLIPEIVVKNMLNNYEQKPRARASVLSNVVKRPNLELNLHTMPQTVSSHWKKWLILGLIILGVCALISFTLYSLTQ